MSRREPQFKKVAHKWWPVFKWQRCEICKEEFRREWGWFLTPWMMPICSRCKRTKQEADEYYNERFVVH